MAMQDRWLTSGRIPNPYRIVLQAAPERATILQHHPSHDRPPWPLQYQRFTPAQVPHPDGAVIASRDNPPVRQFCKENNSSCMPTENHPARSSSSILIAQPRPPHPPAQLLRRWPAHRNVLVPIRPLQVVMALMKQRLGSPVNRRHAERPRQRVQHGVRLQRPAAEQIAHHRRPAVLWLGRDQMQQQFAQLQGVESTARNRAALGNRSGAACIRVVTAGNQAASRPSSSSRGDASGSCGRARASAPGNSR